MVNNKKMVNNNNNKKINNKKKKKIINQPTSINIETIDFSVKDNGEVILELPYIEDINLPYVSIITPTKNKGELFRLAVHQFLNFNYPRNKLEWIILDNGSERVKKYLDFKDESNLIYMTLDPTQNYSIADLRNVCIKKSSYDIIVYMDDDDYYPKESILARVKSLLKYFHRGIECVGCVNALSYNIHHRSCIWVTNGSLNLIEASMCHTKRFWEKRQFNSNDRYKECYKFLKDRHKKIMDIPFQFVCIVLNHNNNYTNRGKNHYNKIKDIENFQIGKAGTASIMIKDNDFLDKILSEDIKKIIYSI
jgi:glycosyltransferase involved in cell wall biosynthesis